MSGDSISAAILTTATVICAVGFIATVYPSVLTAGDPIISRTDVLRDQITTDVKIIHEGNNSEEPGVFIWIKNIGSNQVSPELVRNSDVFFGKEGSFLRIPYDESGLLVPGWSYQIENGGREWKKGETIKVILKLENAVNPGDSCFVKFSLYNGVSDEDYFTI